MDDSFLNDTFYNYYEKAKKAHANGHTELAQRNYLLAAQTLMKLAENSSPKLKESRVNRAKRLLYISDHIEEFIVEQKEDGKMVVTSPAKKNAPEKENPDDENKKVWKAATIPNISFDDIAGLDDVKKSITVRMINPIKYPEKYAAYGKKSGGGVLLYGPPGTGKTMIAKAIAHEVGATFYAVKGSDILSKWVGESEQNISSLFETASQQKLSIIFIDEMDSLFRTRGEDAHNDKRVNEFLQQIDGFTGRNPNLLLLGATNRPWDVDSAAVRSGRFSEKIYIPLPDAPARLFLLKRHLSNAPLSADMDWNVLTQMTEGYSGADIEEICDRAKIDPLYEYINSDVKAPVSLKNVTEAMKKVPKCTTPAEIKQFEDYSNR